MFGIGLMSPLDGDSDSSGSLTAATSSRRSSVVELFRRSKQSRHRRLSVYLQVSVTGILEFTLKVTRIYPNMEGGEGEGRSGGHGGPN